MVEVMAKDLRPNGLTQSRLLRHIVALPEFRFCFFVLCSYAMRHALCLPAEASAQVGAMLFYDEGRRLT